jgi:hypothetical protein
MKEANGSKKPEYDGEILTKDLGFLCDDLVRIISQIPTASFSAQQKYQIGGEMLRLSFGLNKVMAVFKEWGMMI